LTDSRKIALDAAVPYGSISAINETENTDKIDGASQAMEELSVADIGILNNPAAKAQVRQERKHAVAESTKTCPRPGSYKHGRNGNT
jgi:hypothetical protein